MMHTGGETAAPEVVGGSFRALFGSDVGIFLKKILRSGCGGAGSPGMAPRPPPPGGPPPPPPPPSRAEALAGATGVLLKKFIF